GQADVPADAAGVDMALVTCLDAAEPGGSPPVHRADVQVVAATDDPDRPRWCQRAVLPSRRDPKFLSLPDPVELIARPRRHLPSLLMRLLASPARPHPGYVSR